MELFWLLLAFPCDSVETSNNKDNNTNSILFTIVRFFIVFIMPPVIPANATNACFLQKDFAKGSVTIYDLFLIKMYHSSNTFVNMAQPT